MAYISFYSFIRIGKMFYVCSNLRCTLKPKSVHYVCSGSLALISFYVDTIISQGINMFDILCYHEVSVFGAFLSLKVRHFMLLDINWVTKI